MEDAPQQVVAQAGHPLRNPSHHLGKTAHGLGGIRVCRERRQRNPTGLEDGAVVHREDAAPRLAVGVDHRVLLGASRCAGWRPVPVVAVGTLGRQVALDAVMEQHRGSHNQHSALGGYEVPIALRPACAFCARQVQGSRQLPADGRLQFPHHLVQPVREYPRGHVRAAQGARRLLHRLRELRHAARGPLAGRLPRLDAHRPGQRSLGQIALGNVVGVADGERDGREPLPQAGVRVLDCLRLAAEPCLRLQHDPQPLNVRDDIHPPAPGPLLVVRRHAPLAEELGQYPVLEVFLLTHPLLLLRGFDAPTPEG